MQRILSCLTCALIGFLCLSIGAVEDHGWRLTSEAFAFSVEKERKLGEEVAAEIEKRMEIVRDPSVQAYVASLGRRIVSSADRTSFTIRFSVLKESQANAFAIPGGRIYLTTGLIRLVASEGELAGVMSHEVAHVVRRHIAERIEASQRLNLATLAGALAGLVVGGQEGGAIMAGSLAMVEAQKLKYTRENESEADRLGLAYMIRAGYDGRDMVRFLKKMTRTVEYDAAFPSYLSTHPGVPERIGYLEALMADLPGASKSGSSSERLKDVQLRLSIAEKGPLEAVAYYTDLLRTRPDDAELLFGRALAAKEVGRVKDSIEDLKKAHKLKPMDPQILKELGAAFVQAGRLREGVRALERSRSLDQGDAETLYYLGIAYERQERHDLAIESYTKARKLNPDLPGLDRSLAAAYKGKGDVGRFHLYYGLYYRKRGDLKYARFHLEKARELLSRDGAGIAEVRRELERIGE